jgi:hypothetical protein
VDDFSYQILVHPTMHLPKQTFLGWNSFSIALLIQIDLG